jgi:hypothetical protein
MNLVHAQSGFASFLSSEGSIIKLTIAGIEINKQPKSKVSVKGKPGVKVVSIAIYNQQEQCVDYYDDEVFILPGFRTEYSIVYDEKCGIGLQKTSLQPTSSKYLKNPRYYFNRMYIAGYIIPSLRLNCSTLESRNLPFSHFNTLALC